MSLRRRLAVAFVALIASSTVLVAAVSLVVVRASLEAALNAKLLTLAKGVADIVDDDGKGNPYVTRDDVVQLRSLISRGEHVVILARDGRRLYGEAMPVGTNARHVQIAEAPAAHKGFHDADVTTWRNTNDIDAVMRWMLLAYAALGVIMSTVGIFFSGLVTRRILEPVQRIADLAERIETSDLSERLNAGGRDEFSRVCGSFDRMLERLEASFAAQRRFVADASHELRTPLAVVRAETDLALRRMRSSAEYVSALESIDRETARLEGLVDQLLATMRHEALVQTKPLDLRIVVAEVVDHIRPAAEAIVLRSTAGEAVVRADRAALERALRAIFHNAIVHGGGTIDVTLQADDTSVSIAVADRGPGFTEAALAHATERFWRDDSARCGGGSGLGLSIASILLEALGGSLRLENGERGGAVVLVALPRVHAVIAN